MSSFGYYYNKEETFSIPNAAPVSVIVSFNTKGEFIPIYVQLFEDEERITKKIDSIIRINDKNAVIEFTCSVQVDKNIKKQIVLIYSIQQMKWYLKQ